MFKNAKKILIIALVLAFVAIAGGFGSVAADPYKLDETGTLIITKNVSGKENITWEFGDSPSADDPVRISNNPKTCNRTSQFLSLSAKINGIAYC